VSIAPDDLVLYGGFDLTDPATSISMTINGRRRSAYMNAAISNWTFRTDNGANPLTTKTPRSARGR
jgi:methylmalonyl-CoA mutase